jgi:hypothetical protein
MRQEVGKQKKWRAEARQSLAYPKIARTRACVPTFTLVFLFS